MNNPIDRRKFLVTGGRAMAYLTLAKSVASCASSDAPALPESGEPSVSSEGGKLGEIGPLGEPIPDLNIRIPEGFSARVLGQANQIVPGTNLLWHTDPDGEAVFAAEDGGWIYVSNCEFLPGGANALRFDAAGEVVDGYNVLPGALSRINCGGGVTPWGTWLSGEEYDLGLIWECDPAGVDLAQSRPALGTFKHEAATVNPATNIFFLTEDEGDGRFYRFVPDNPNVGGVPDYSSGRLQAMQVLATQEEVDMPGTFGPKPVEWLDIPNPNPVLVPEAPQEMQPQTPTRLQVPESTAFRGGEGIWFSRGIVFFTTKGDRRVWAHDPVASTVEVIYDDFGIENPILDSVDNIVATPGGDLIIVEDKSEANQQAVAIRTNGDILPLVQLVDQEGSEVTGPAFSPDGRHFYFSSQRGPGANSSAGTAGMTYCVTGPWFAS